MIAVLIIIGIIILAACALCLAAVLCAPSLERTDCERL